MLTLRKSWTFLIALALLLGFGGSLLSSCATRTAQQKKSAWYKRHRGGKTAPCPCDR